jgi:UDP-3-O-[3-hydroxymyristoyl] N-acetylglucosamine deacetylase
MTEVKYIHQKTIAKKVSMQGIGLHSGKAVKLSLLPASENSGVIFKRTDVSESEALVFADFRAVSATMLGTTLENKFGVEVATIEHLMAALWGMEIDNVLVEVNSPEIPIMDGSSAPFVELVKRAGVLTQAAPRKILRILDEIRVGDKKKYAKLIPSEKSNFGGFSVRFEIDFDDKAIARQKNEFNFEAKTFVDEIARARTFCMKRDVDTMHAAGLARGGSLENAVVVDDGKVLNPEGLRFTDEALRHKVLDSIGDLFLAKHRIQGGFIGYKSGHKINNEALRTLFENDKAWELVDEVQASGLRTSDVLLSKSYA